MALQASFVGFDQGNPNFKTVFQSIQDLLDCMLSGRSCHTPDVWFWVWGGAPWLESLTLDETWLENMVI